MSVGQGETVTLTAMVTSARRPFRGQWRFNSKNILAAMYPATLTLTNVAASQSGRYDFIASNDQGTSTGSTTLEVVRPFGLVGRLDPGYNARTRLQVMDGIFSLALQPDGSAVIGGGFNSFNGMPCTNLARVDAVGNVDTNFNTARLAAGIYPAFVYSLAGQPEGKLLVGGTFTLRLFRVDAAGVLDTSFVPSYNARVYSLTPQPDGRVLLGTASGIMRVPASGGYGYDGTFSATAVKQAIRVIALQPDGKILAGGTTRALPCDLPWHD